MHKALILLTKIPKGRITTYGALAKATNSSPRAIGQVMRRNKQPELYPCYKVINKSGNLGGYCSSTSGSSIKHKIKLLKADGIVIKNNKIDKKFFYQFAK